MAHGQEIVQKIVRWIKESASASQHSLLTCEGELPGCGVTNALKQAQQTLEAAGYPSFYLDWMELYQKQRAYSTDVFSQALQENVPQGTTILFLDHLPWFEGPHVTITGKWLAERNFPHMVYGALRFWSPPGEGQEHPWPREGDRTAHQRLSFSLVNTPSDFPFPNPPDKIPPWLIQQVEEYGKSTGSKTAAWEEAIIHYFEDKWAHWEAKYLPQGKYIPLAQRLEKYCGHQSLDDYEWLHWPVLWFVREASSTLHPTLVDLLKRYCEARHKEGNR